MKMPISSSSSFSLFLVFHFANFAAFFRIIRVCWCCVCLRIDRRRWEVVYDCVTGGWKCVPDRPSSGAFRIARIRCAFESLFTVLQKFQG